MVFEARELSRRVLVRGEERQLLRGLSLRVAPGDVLGITGPRGSGKTLLLRVLLGLDARTSGEIRWKGEPISSSDLPRLRCDVAMIAAEGPSETMSARALFALARTFSARQGRPLALELDQFLPPLGLDPSLLDRSLSALAESERYRARLALAVALSPSYLVLDAFDRALPDPRAERRRYFEMKEMLPTWIRAQAQRGLGVILATRDETLLAGVASEIMILFDGELHAAGPADELLRGSSGASRLGSTG